MHLESSRHSDAKNYVYCTKSGQYFEYGERKAMGKQKCGTRTDIARLKQDLDNGATFDEVSDKHFETLSRMDSFIRKYITNRDNQAAKMVLREEYANVVWQPWQQSLLASLQQPADARTVQWLWEPKGKVGKSWISTYLDLTMNAVVLSQGKKADLAKIWADRPGPQWPVVIFDIPLSVITSDGVCPMQHLIALAEEMKNGRVTSTKYESGVVFRPPPHVVFFANFEPNRAWLSEDRWKIHKIVPAAAVAAAPAAPVISNLSEVCAATV